MQKVLMRNERNLWNTIPNGKQFKSHMQIGLCDKSPKSKLSPSTKGTIGYCSEPFIFIVLEKKNTMLKKMISLIFYVKLAHIA